MAFHIYNEQKKNLFIKKKNQIYNGVGTILLITIKFEHQILFYFSCNFKIIKKKYYENCQIYTVVSLIHNGLFTNP